MDLPSEPGFYAIVGILRLIWYTVVYYGILWCTMVYCGVLWYTVVYVPHL